MRRVLSRLAAPVIAVLIVSGWLEPVRSAPVQPATPSLAVVIVVDGLSWPTLSRYRPWFTAGLKRLLDEGSVFDSAHYLHLNTETSPSHAALSTGAPPRVTGIVANRWLELGRDKVIRSVYSTQMYGPEEAPPAPATMTGPGNLRVETLGDRLVAADAQSRVVAVSAKDRASVLLAGRNPRHLSYWFDQDTGRFTTSAYYDSVDKTGAAGRTVVARFNREKAGGMLPGRFGLHWDQLTPIDRPDSGPLFSRPMPQAGLAEFQVPTNGLGFPHDLTFGPRGYFTGFYTSPFVDELVADLAVAWLTDDTFALGQNAAPDVLYVGFSAQDTVSHAYGSESAENLDVLRRLDIQIGRLFDALAVRNLRRDRVVVALSADHGMAPIPEAARARDKSWVGGRIVDGDRVYPTFYQRLNRGIDEALCLPPGSSPVYGGESWSLTYNRPALPMQTIAGPCGDAGRAMGPADIDRVLPEVARKLFDEELVAVLPVSQRSAWLQDSPAGPYADNDYDAERSGDAFIIPRPGVVITNDPARGTGHGSHYDFDTHVPLVFWGEAWPSQQTSAEVTPYDLAPTLAGMLGITLPAATGHDLRPTMRK